MPEKNQTYTSTQILKVAGVQWYKLGYLVSTGKVKPLNKGRGHERRFAEGEALKAINILRPGSISNVEELQKLADSQQQGDHIDA